MLAMLLMASSASAQTLGVVWERFGLHTSPIAQSTVEGLDLRAGVNGGGDTLFAASERGIFRFDPGATDWLLLCGQAICRSEKIALTPKGFIIVGERVGPSSGGVRSIDGGSTWENDVIGYAVTVLQQSSLPILNGALLAGNGGSLLWSHAGGARGTWTVGGDMLGEPVALVEIPESTSVPNGRLVAGVWSGLVYSDDGGVTWNQSNVYDGGRFTGNSVTFSADGSSPFGGTVYAAVRDFHDGYPSVYRSVDGGESWTLTTSFRPGDFDVDEPDWIVLQAGRKGAIYAGVEDIPGGPVPSKGVMVASLDGAETWTAVGDSTNGWAGYGAKVLRLDRDGRLYVGTDMGVWRTVSPVPTSTVDEIPHAQERGLLELSVAPNPVENEARVTFLLSQSVAVHLSLYDLTGRLAAVVGRDFHTAGSHSITFSTAGFAAGTYVLTATAGSGTEELRLESKVFSIVK